MNQQEAYELAKDITEDLDNAYNNGYCELLTMRPKEVLDDLVECSGRNYSELPQSEAGHALSAIINWQFQTKRRFFYRPT